MKVRRFLYRALLWLPAAVMVAAMLVVLISVAPIHFVAGQVHRATGWVLGLFIDLRTWAMENKMARYVETQIKCQDCNGQGAWPDDEVLDGDDPNCQCCGGDGYHRGGPCPSETK